MRGRDSKHIGSANFLPLTQWTVLRVLRACLIHEQPMLLAKVLMKSWEPSYFLANLQGNLASLRRKPVGIC